MNLQRLESVKKQTVAQGLDGIALVPGPNMVYVSGIHSHLSERPILLFLPADDDPAIIIPSLEAMKARDAGIPEDRIAIQRVCDCRYLGQGYELRIDAAAGAIDDAWVSALSERF
ncbi:MAG: aminopeptidase P family N-terminal domain-containing protein, partial [Anaerolineae bacterium]